MTYSTQDARAQIIHATTNPGTPLTADVNAEVQQKLPLSVRRHGIRGALKGRARRTAAANPHVPKALRTAMGY